MIHTNWPKLLDLLHILILAFLRIHYVGHYLYPTSIDLSAYYWLLQIPIYLILVSFYIYFQLDTFVSLQKWGLDIL